MTIRRCRECGCTEDRACVDFWGDACAWSERDPTICSYCDENVPCDPGGPPPVRAAFAGAGALSFVNSAQPRAEYDRDWCLRMAQIEGDAEIGAGLLAIDPVFEDAP